MTDTIAGAAEPETIAQPRPKRKRVFLVVGVVVILGLLGAGIGYWLDSRNYESADDAFIDAQMVRVAPQVSGIVEQLAVSPNQRVEQGDLLVVINPDTVEAMLSQQQAGVAQAIAGSGNAQSQLTAARARLAQARAAVAAPLAAYEQARSDLARLQQAQSIEGGSVAANRIDAARTAVATARAQLTSAQQAVSIAAAEVQTAQQAIRAAEASQAAAQARVDEARLTLGQNRIVAPFSGYVANISVNTGSYVSPGTQMMALVPDDLWVTANFKETQLDTIRVGQPVAITVDAYPGLNLHGRVDSIQRAAGQAFALLPSQNATGNYVKVVQRVPVRITFTDPLPADLPFGPGMSVIPTIDVRPQSTSPNGGE